MGCQDSFSSASLPAVLAFFIILLTNFCNWLSFTTTAWYVVELPNDPNGDTHHGLWRQCRTKLISGCVTLDGYADSRLAAAQAFAVFGFCSVNIACIMIIFYVFLDMCKRRVDVAFATGLLLIMAALFWTLAAVVFSLGYNVGGAKVNYSFGFGVCAGILSLIVGLLMIYISRTEGTPRHATVPSKA